MIDVDVTRLESAKIRAEIAEIDYILSTPSTGSDIIETHYRELRRFRGCLVAESSRRNLSLPLFANSAGGD
jgi:hypothetical protein